jgi:hypothetical protein
MTRTALYATAGSALALALLATSLPASADVNVFATISKTKDIHITETIAINKYVNLTVHALGITYNAAAEADAIVNQENTHNRVDSSHEQLDVDIADVNNFGIDLDASIAGSITGNTGIVNVNQDVGNMSNQGNEVDLSIATPAVGTGVTHTPVLVHAQSEAQQVNQGNAVWHGEDPTHLHVAPGSELPVVSLVDGFNEGASITDSINSNIGIVNVNQNAGNNNNQANSEALAVALDLAGVALSEAALGQVNSNPTNQENGFPAVFEFGVSKQANMTGSLNGNTGVGGVNQAAGNMANQANIFSLAFIDGGGGVGLGSGVQ